MQWQEEQHVVQVRPSYPAALLVLAKASFSCCQFEQALVLYTRGRRLTHTDSFASGADKVGYCTGWQSYLVTQTYSK